MAELFVARPDRTWKALSKLAGPSVRWMPTSFPLLVGSLLQLPPTVATKVSGDRPLVGVVATGDDELPRVTLGVHVQSGRELVAALTTGNTPSHEARRDGQSGVVVLAPRRGKADVAIGVVNDYLLVSSRAEDLKRLGSFVARTLPKRDPPAGSVVMVARRAALAGPVSGRIRAVWKRYRAELEKTDRHNRQKHGGRAPDFGDPAAALLGVDTAVEGLATILGSARLVRLVVEPRAGHLEARLEVEAQKQGAAAEIISDLQVGDLEPLLKLPKSSVVALSSRISKRARDSWAKSTSEGLQSLFGDRLSDADRTRLQQTLVTLAQGRGDQISYGLTLSAAGPSVVMRGPVGDAEAFDRGAKGLFRLLRVRAFAEPVRQFVGEVKLQQGTVKVEGLEGSVGRARLMVKPSGMRAARGKAGRIDLAPKPIEFMWWTSENAVYGASAREATAALVDVVACARNPDRTLAADAPVAAAAKRAGREVSFALLLQPLALTGGSPAAGSAPLLLSIGRTERTGWLKVDLHQAALSGLLQTLVKR